MRIVLVGSGTGGHFYPLIAIAEAVRKRNGGYAELYFIGPGPYDKTVLDQHNITFVYCPAGKRRIYRSILNYFDIFKTIYGTFLAFWKLLYLYPDVIMSKGGYTTVPVIVAAWLLRIPIVIHESDAVAGRANIFASKFARYIAIAHAEATTYFPKEKTAHVGLPIRQDFFTKISNPHTIIGIPNDRPVVLITGGSLGAATINNLVLESLNELLPLYTVVHQTGDAHVSTVQQTAAKLITDPQMREHYFAFGYMDAKQFSAAQDAASLIVSRAGSGTIFEIALKNKPSIIIPISEEVSRDQRSNAYAYAGSGAATVLEEHNLTDDLLASEIKYILENKDVYQNMQAAARNFTRTDAADTIANILLEIGREHGAS
ncbi:MAG: UDP-N-acetylglucosamine--N-acetylmuramyl-(pentapeptide) pyrophosphoryl-undecaprenol N-acetylglucosamine transferase [Candidatus Paceibacterota bacterium]